MFSDLLKCLEKLYDDSKKSYYLFMLGSETFFTPKGNEISEGVKDYEYGETLSFTAAFVALSLDEKTCSDDQNKKLNCAVSFSSDSVAVVNGPDGFGTLVGKGIATGLFQILKAALSGQSNIYIAGHSRGACETILICHELKRIIDALEADPPIPIKDILTNSPCGYTKPELVKLFSDVTTIDDHQKINILTRLKAINLHVNLLDPVPGGNKFKLMGWHDDRFYQPIPLVKNTELTLMRDERTGCFKPIVPQGVAVNVLPGYHGSASGGLRNHDGKNLAELYPKEAILTESQKNSSPSNLSLSKTSASQMLHLIQLLHFLGINRDFDLDTIQNDPLFDAAVPLFDAIKSFKKDGYRKTMLYYFEEALKYDSLFRRFADSFYSFFLWRDVSQNGNRIVHVHSKATNEDFEKLTRPVSEFVNLIHAELYIDDLLLGDLPRSTIGHSASDGDLSHQLFGRVVAFVKEIKNNPSGSLKSALSEHEDSIVNAFNSIIMAYSHHFLELNNPEERLKEVFTLLDLLSEDAGELNEFISQLKVFSEQSIELALAYFKDHSEQVLESTRELFCLSAFKEARDEHSQLFIKSLGTMPLTLSDIIVSCEKFKNDNKAIFELSDKSKPSPDETELNERMSFIKRFDAFYAGARTTNQELYHKVAKVYRDVGIVEKFLPHLIEKLPNHEALQDNEVFGNLKDNAVQLAGFLCYQGGVDVNSHFSEDIIDVQESYLIEENINILCKNKSRLDHEMALIRKSYHTQIESLNNRKAQLEKALEHPELINDGMLTHETVTLAAIAFDEVSKPVSYHHVSINGLANQRGHLGALEAEIHKYFHEHKTLCEKLFQLKQEYNHLVDVTVAVAVKRATDASFLSMCTNQVEEQVSDELVLGYCALQIEDAEAGDYESREQEALQGTQSPKPQVLDNSVEQEALQDINSIKVKLNAYLNYLHSKGEHHAVLDKKQSVLHLIGVLDAQGSPSLRLDTFKNELDHQRGLLSAERSYKVTVSLKGVCYGAIRHGSFGFFQPSPKAKGKLLVDQIDQMITKRDCPSLN